MTLSLRKIAIVSLVLMASLALDLGTPAFTSNQHTLPASEKKLIKNPQAQESATRDIQPVSDLQNIESGTLYFVSNTSNEFSDNYLPSPSLKSEVHIKVTGLVARTSVTQTFKNNSNKWVNGLYLFPLPEASAVDHLLMTVGNRKIEGQIKEKEQAKKIFDKAKIEGKKASLVYQYRPNMFSNSVANIGPGEKVVVTIEYQQKLTFNNEQYSLRFPMTFTPRYFPSNNTNHEHSNITQNFSTKRTNNIQLQVNLQTGFEIKNIHSDFHDISTKRLSDGSHHITLSGNSVANRDFVLSWKPFLEATPQVTHFKQQVDGSEYGLVMVLPPKSEMSSKSQINIQGREVIFVLDTSGSMSGSSITQAKQALSLAVDQLNETDKFNIIEFNSYAQNLWRLAKNAGQANKTEAKHFVASLSANGGTEIGKALSLAFSSTNKSEPLEDEAKNHPPSRLRQIVFITDGSVGNEESLMQLIDTHLGEARLFTVGIGSAPNIYFMTEAAKMGRGTFTYIGATHQVKEKMTLLLNKLKHPALTDIEVHVNPSGQSPNKSIEFYPNVIADLYLGEPLIFTYKLENGSSASNQPYLSQLTLSAQYDGKKWQNEMAVFANTRQSGLNVLWAREKITQLTRDKRRASRRQGSTLAEQNAYRDSITQTALAHHLVSQYTSLVAVDVTPTRPESANIMDGRIANVLPQGTPHTHHQRLGKLPQTATKAEMKIMIGLILIGLAICMHSLTKRKMYFRRLLP